MAQTDEHVNDQEPLIDKNELMKAIGATDATHLTSDQLTALAKKIHGAPQPTLKAASDLISGVDNLAGTLREAIENVRHGNDKGLDATSANVQLAMGKVDVFLAELSKALEDDKIDTVERMQLLTMFSNAVAASNDFVSSENDRIERMTNEQNRTNSNLVGQFIGAALTLGSLALAFFVTTKDDD